MQNEFDYNIFRYATKELSQDAVICWLIKWAGRQGVQDEALRDCGRRFVEALLAEHGAPLDGAIKKIKILKQHKIPKQRNRIDVLARINGPQGQVLLIEDKTDTGEHGDQLKIYYDAVVKGKTGLGEVCEENLYPIFLKTGNQSLADDKRIEESMKTSKSYKVFNRKKFLEVLNDYEGSNSILLDFRAHLQEREDDTNSFKDWKKEEREEWSWNAWQGFFRHLEKQEVDCEGWHYVHNQQGGFLGLWWSGKDIKKGGIKEGRIYLQLEVVPEKPDEQKLCFKVAVDNKENWSVTRNKWRKWCEAAAAEVAGIEATKPKRFGTGWHMTVAQWGKEEKESGTWLAFDSYGRLDKEATVANLKKAEAVLAKAIDMERQGGETQS